MSTTSASCCCDDTTRANYAVYVKGSGSDANTDTSEGIRSAGWNENSLNLYLNEVETCLTCDGSSEIHGGVTVRVYTEDAYLYDVRNCGFQGGDPPRPTRYYGYFIIPYKGTSPGIGEAVLQYFPKTGGVVIDSVKKTIDIRGGIPELERRSGTTLKDFLYSYINSTPLEQVNGLPVKICDCFTDALYTSEDKTKDENFKALALQALCSHWSVGVNAQNIVWKQPLFLGTHDTTVGNLKPGQFANEVYYNSGETEGGWPPAQTRFATTLFLPKGWKKDGYLEPTMLNMEALMGRNREKSFTEDPTRPVDWAPWVQGFSHNTPKTERFSFIRLFLGVLRFAPDGLVGFPFDGVETLGSVFVPPLWLSSRTWTDPDYVDWAGSYSEAVSRIMSPTVPEYIGRRRVIDAGFASGTITGTSDGCRTSTACGSSGRIGQTTEITSTPGSTYKPPKSIFEKRPADTDVLWAKANLEYATGKDSSLFSSNRRNSLVYYTVNNDTPNRCSRLPEPILGKYRIEPGGPSQRGCCCVGSFPTDIDTSDPTSGSSICPTFYSSYTLGFPGIRRGKIGNQKNPYISFYTVDNSAIFPGQKTYSKNIQFYAKYQPVRGCGTIVTDDYRHMSTDTVPQAWWCTDVGQQVLSSIFYPKQTEQEQKIYYMVSYPQYYRGTSAKKVPTTTNGGPASAFWNCNIRDECPPGGGLLVVVTVTHETKCVTGDSPDPDPQPDIGNGIKYICGGVGGCSVSQEELAACSWDKSGPFSSSDCLPGSFSTWRGQASIVSYCEWINGTRQPGDISPYENPQEECCYIESIPPDACSEFTPSVSSDGSICVPNKIASPENNPFIAFTQTRQNYGSLLNELGSFFRVKQYTKDPVKKAYIISPTTGVNIADFTSKNYKQSLITHLRGKKLEFGSIDLKSWAPVLENTYGPYGVDYRRPSELPNTSTINKIKAGLEYSSRKIPPNHCDGNLEHIKPEWPQSSVPPPITKSKAPNLNPDRTEEELAKQIYKRVLSSRKDKYPEQKGTSYDYAVSTSYPGNPDRAIALEKMREYWDTRMRWELADAFVLNYDKGITGDYYPKGIPDLQYTKKKIRIRKDGNIDIVEAPEPYELNWFYVPFETVVQFE